MRSSAGKPLPMVTINEGGSSVFGRITKVQTSLQSLKRKCTDDESGATAIEYGLIVGGIAVAILATVFAIGGELNNFFRVVQTWLGNA